MFSLTQDSINPRVISPLIGDRVPSFVKETFPNFRKFIEAYISWGEQNGNVFQILGLLKNARDIDLTADQFVIHLIREFAPTFSEGRVVDAGINSDGSPTYNAADWTFLKYIGDYYRTKGTPQSFEYFFKLLYNVDVKVFYPRTKILCSSDGNWIQPYRTYILAPSSIHLTLDSYENLYIPVSYSISGGPFNALGVVNGVKVVNSIGGSSVLELTFSEIPDFIATSTDSQFILRIDGVEPDSALINIDLTDLSAAILGNSYQPLSTIRSFEIADSGTNWAVGEKIVLLAVNGADAYFEVTSIDAVGGIRGLAYTSVGYDSVSVQNVFSDYNNSFKLTNSGTGEALTVLGGYFSKSDGYISLQVSTLSNNNIVLEDNYYFQNHSYVVDVKDEYPPEFNVEEYVRTNHPAGFQYFIFESPYTESVTNTVNDICTQLCLADGSCQLPPPPPYISQGIAMQMGMDLENFSESQSSSFIQNNLNANIEFWIGISSLSTQTVTEKSSVTTAGIEFWIGLRNFTQT